MSRDEVKGREHRIARLKQMTAVFRRFSAVWPRAFAPSQWDAIMDTWLDNAWHVDTDVLDRAAREYLRTAKPQYPPKPWDFGDFARKYTQQTAVVYGGVQGPGSIPARRVWEWVSPNTKRICRVEEFPDGFGCSNLDSQWEFDKLTHAGKVEHCEKMVTDHADFLRKSA
jgi:hypothetical protein